MEIHALDRIVGSRTLRTPDRPASRPRRTGSAAGASAAGTAPLTPALDRGFASLPSPPVSPVEPVRPARPPTTFVIGVLGGIASGKSMAARLLAGPRGLVLSADEIAHQVLESPEVRALLAQRFGPEAIGADGRVDRAAIARAVFGPEGAARRSELEGWTHPRVRDRIWARLEQARASGIPRVVLDVPLLLENDAQHGLARACDVLVFVEAPEAERDRRARESRGWAPGEVARREAAQWPLAEKKRRASHVIPNTEGPEELAARVARLADELALP